MNTQDFIQLGSVLVALIAVVVGPLVAISTSKHQSDSTIRAAELQARASVLSTSRQAWINELRSEVAGFLSIATLIDSGFVQKHSDSELRPLITQLMLQLSKVQLLINPNEADHAALIDKMLGLAASVLGDGQDEPAITREITELAQTVLKREWERVKQFS